jgi:hypothetical protein
VDGWLTEIEAEIRHSTSSRGDFLEEFARRISTLPVGGTATLQAETSARAPNASPRFSR